jgi:BlaI family transcriptional regulator, penicillinase repressor
MMARPSSQLLTDREAQLMEVLWVQGSATAEAIRDALPDQPHDSTVRTLMRVLKQKGYVRIRGRQPAVYEPRIDRLHVQSTATRSMLARFFGGSAEALVLRLVEDEQLSPQQLNQLRKSLSQRKRKGGKS